MHDTPRAALIDLTDYVAVRVRGHPGLALLAQCAHQAGALVEQGVQADRAVAV